jgi:hypothetical protein
MRWLPLLLPLLCAAWPLLASEQDTRAQLCQLATRDYLADPRSAEAEGRLRAACYSAPGRSPELRPPIVVGVPAAPVVPVSPAVPEIQMPSSPSVLTSCDAGGCWDNLGRRYSGTGPVYSGPGGAVCTRNGDRIECR